MGDPAILKFFGTFAGHIIEFRVILHSHFDKNKDYQIKSDVNREN